MKKILLALAVAGAAVSAQADVKLSGHVNTSFGNIEEFNQNSAGVNDAANANFSANNAGTSQSRFRITADKKVGGITYGIKEEVGLAAGGTALNVRVNEVTMSGNFGKFSAGLGSEASDGAVESSFSSTWVTWDDISNFEFGGEFSTYEYIDGGRTQRVRYDSPKLGGLATISIDLQDDDDSSIALRLGNSNFSAALYHLNKDTGGADEFGGSAAIKAGIFVASYGFATRDDNTVGAKDKEHKAFNIGIETASYGITVDRQTTEDDATATAAGEVATTGLNFTYKPTGGVVLYASLRKIEADVTSTTAQTAGTNSLSGNGAIAGARITF